MHVSRCPHGCALVITSHFRANVCKISEMYLRRSGLLSLTYCVSPKGAPLQTSSQRNKLMSAASGLTTVDDARCRCELCAVFVVNYCFSAQSVADQVHCVCSVFFSATFGRSDTTTKARFFYRCLAAGSCTNSAPTPQGGDRKAGSLVLWNKNSNERKKPHDDNRRRTYMYACSESAAVFLPCCCFTRPLPAHPRSRAPDRRRHFVGCRWRIYFLPLTCFCCNTDSTCNSPIPIFPFFCRLIFLNFHSSVLV